MVQSFKVASTLAAQRIVGVTAAETVGYPAAATNLPVGVTKDTVLDTTSAIGVAGPGEIAKIYFNDTVAAAGLVAADSSGRGVPFSATSTNAYVGVLLGPAVAATGTIAQVLIQPGYGG